MIQRGQNGEQRRAPIRPDYIKYHLAACQERRYSTPQSLAVIFVPIFFVAFSLFSGQRFLFFRRRTF